MIGIINVSDHDDVIGLNTYRLQINHKIIGEFEHNRSEGLVLCLERAAECAKQALKENSNL